jgi:hypothetical protein
VTVRQAGDPLARRSPGFWREYRLLIGCSTVLWVAVLAGGWVAYRYVQPLLTLGLFRSPPDLADAGVVHGAGVLGKARFLRDAGIDGVTAISTRQRGPGDAGGLTVVGSRGAVLTDSLGRIEGRVAFAPGSRTCLDRVEPIAGPDGSPLGFLARGSWACSVARLDRQGRVLWRYGGSIGVDDAAVADLEGDGRLDFVVGFNGDGGVHRVDDAGRAVWTHSDSNVWRVALLDTDGDGRPEILHSNAAGLLVIRDQTGRVIRRVNAPIYLSHFSPVSWPGAGRPALLQMDDGEVRVLDASGASVATLPAPRAKSTLDARGTPVRLKAGQPEAFAVVGSHAPWRRSVVYVYGADHALLYEEILADACAAIAPLPAPAGHPEAILVGCDGVVWRYDLK